MISTGQFAFSRLVSISVSAQTFPGNTAINAIMLRILTLVEQAVTYRTPLFEEISLSRQDVVASGDWRKGDLLALIASDQAEPLITGICRIESDNWGEVLIGKSKIKIRLTGSPALSISKSLLSRRFSPFMKALTLGAISIPMSRTPATGKLAVRVLIFAVFSIKGCVLTIVSFDSSPCAGCG